MQKEMVVFVVGHESWGKSRTLRSLIAICRGHGRRVVIVDHEFFLRMTSNDDRPRAYRRFAKSARRPYIVAALCPKFKKFRRIHGEPEKEVDRTLQGMQERGFRLFFWVLKHKWRNPARMVTTAEISEMHRYGIVRVFGRQNVQANKRASDLRAFIAGTVLR